MSALWKSLAAAFVITATIAMFQWIAAPDLYGHPDRLADGRLLFVGHAPIRVENSNFTLERDEPVQCWNVSDEPDLFRCCHDC